MKFQYTALGSNNQKLEGVLDAESLDAARQELHKMGLSVLAINEAAAQAATTPAPEGATVNATETTKPGGIQTYYFLARDTQKKEVNGTIDSKDELSAFRRLMTEYGFEVLDLYPENASDPASASFKAKFEEWKGLLQDEGIDLSPKPISGVKDELAEEGERLNEEIISEMDQFIINTKKIMEQHRQQYSEALFNEIQKTLDELERIRASNNLKHITKVCNKLYELISNPDAIQLDTEGELDQGYSDTISELKDSGFVANRFQFMEAHNLQKKAERFERVQKIFGRIFKAFNRKKADQIDQKIAGKLKGHHASWMSKLTKSLQGRSKGKSPVSLKEVVAKYFAYLTAGNTILRRARKMEAAKAYKEWRGYKDSQAKSKKVEQATSEEGQRRDFSNFFMELNSFVGWLLFFYITYFFLVSFSIEKNIGLPKTLVLRTLNTPLILNISIFLLFAHLAFTLKLKLFSRNALGSLFLLFFTFGIYTIVILNF